MTRNELINQIKKKKSYLCIGLDPDTEQMPLFFSGFRHPLFEFNRMIVDATYDISVAYKPNFAFYEAFGSKGIDQLKKTIRYIRKNYPDLLIIADAKRGDIGNTSKMYAREIFEILDCDAVTLSPYMGKDSIEPFLSYSGKWVIVLAVTSNTGSEDFQMLKTYDNRHLYEKVIEKAMKWGTPDNMMFVTGATQPFALADIRRMAPAHFFLVPGVGKQGGNLEAVSKAGLITNEGGLLVNASRNILYASKEKNFNEKAREAALIIQQEMKNFL